MKATKALPEVKMCDATSERGREREREKKTMFVYVYAFSCTHVCSDVREMHCLMLKIVTFWPASLFSAATYPVRSHVGQESVDLERSWRVTHLLALAFPI